MVGFLQVLDSSTRASRCIHLLEAKIESHFEIPFRWQISSGSTGVQVLSGWPEADIRKRDDRMVDVSGMQHAPPGGPCLKRLPRELFYSLFSTPQFDTFFAGGQLTTNP